MATKKTKSATKAKGATTEKSKTTKTDAAKKPSQATLIVDLLTRKVEPAKVLDQVKAACGGKPTIGYIKWLGRKKNLLAVAP